jgi:hypothetical protein
MSRTKGAVVRRHLQAVAEPEPTVHEVTVAVVVKLDDGTEYYGTAVGEVAAGLDPRAAAHAICTRAHEKAWEGAS